jgi:hypothetical protein
MKSIPSMRFMMCIAFTGLVRLVALEEHRAAHREGHRRVRRRREHRLRVRPAQRPLQVRHRGHRAGFAVVPVAAIFVRRRLSCEIPEALFQRRRAPHLESRHESLKKDRGKDSYPEANAAPSPDHDPVR